MASRKLAELRAEQTASGEIPGLLDYFVQLNPTFERPDHLAPIAEAIEAAIQSGGRLGFSVPSQHGKTELIKAAMVWTLARYPTSRNAYATYEANRSYRVGNGIRSHADRMGMATKGGQIYWETRHGGSVISTGVGGPLTGEPITGPGLLVVDDPHKNMAEASSAIKRETIREWLGSTAEARCHPGACVLVVHTRWHPDDTLGSLENDGFYRVLNLPAINDGTDPSREIGAPLWPSQRPLEWLREKRELLGEHSFDAIYQGQPKAKGGALFREAAATYRRQDLPRHQVRWAIGLDLAYTAKTSADWSVAVVMVAHAGRYYVVHVERGQEPADKFLARLEALKARFPAAPFWWRAGGTEKGVLQLLHRSGIEIHRAEIRGDKHAMAQPAALAWNEGRLLVPEDAKATMGKFMRVVERFTGVGDKHDDDVDALGTAYDALWRSSGRGGAAYVPGRYS